MKKQLSVLAAVLLFFSCAPYQSIKCPSTDKKYFTKGIKGSKPIYKGYGGKKHNYSSKKRHK
ncbi:MAG: hypothetical protein IM568_11780 [Flavobacterium sp.]|nr:hypothetical protein [Flavobacterium sp.]